MTIMHLDYEFHYDGQLYWGRGIDIGETDNIEAEANDIESLKESAIFHALKLEDLSEITPELKNACEFNYCELEV